LIKNINNKIYIIENYISPSSSELMTNVFNKNLFDTPDYQIKGGPSLSPKDGYTYQCGNPIIKYKNENKHDIAVDLLTMICTSMSKTISNFTDKQMDIKTMFYSLMLEGSENNLHTDNYHEIKNINSIRKNSENDWSGLLYLNDEYEGGTLEFPEENFHIKPNPGTFIFFQGSHDLPHKVSKVTKGQRNVIVSFFWPSEYRGLDTVLG
jgi:predicted 2-oxoglutarate/Fe(II)-dependent dioxygenase YbiX